MSGRAQRMTIEDHRLHRVLMEYDEADVRFMEPYLGMGPYGWQGYEVEKRPGWQKADGIETINTYTISLTHQAYVTMYINLAEGQKIDARRLISMRHRDMIADNLRAAGGDLRRLRFLGVGLILNRFARESIVRAFAGAGRDILDRGAVEITPGHQPELLRDCIRTNPFIRGQYQMFHGAGADREETGGAFMKRIIFVSAGFDRPPGHVGGPTHKNEPQLYIVTELGRP